MENKLWTLCVFTLNNLIIGQDLKIAVLYLHNFQICLQRLQ